MLKIAVFGAGTWGIALARLLAAHGRDVTVWSAIPAELKALATTRRHPNLPGMELPAAMHYTADIAEACTGRDILVFAVPSPFVRATAKKAAPHIPQGQLIVDVAKGVEDKTDEEVEEDNEEESDEEESEKDRTEKFSKSRNLPSTRTIKSLATPVRKSIVGTVDKPPFTVAVGQSRGMHDEVMKAIQEVYDSEPQDIDMNTDPHEYVRKDREMLELMKKGNLFEL